MRSLPSESPHIWVWYYWSPSLFSEVAAIFLAGFLCRLFSYYWSPFCVPLRILEKAIRSFPVFVEVSQGIPWYTFGGTREWTSKINCWTFSISCRPKVLMSISISKKWIFLSDILQRRICVKESCGDTLVKKRVQIDWRLELGGKLFPKKQAPERSQLRDIAKASCSRGAIFHASYWEQNEKENR